MFRAAMADVKPLASEAVRNRTAPPRNRVRVTRRPAPDRGTVHATLDLHGCSAEAARRRLLEFIADATAHGLRRLRIVHGKGLRSGPTGPVLRSVVERELESCDDVEEFQTATSADGGTGAVIVQLRAAGRPRGRR